MPSTIGRILKLTTFGESHGAALGGVVDGFPAGITIDMDFITKEMARRRPGSTKLGTTRKEGDEPRILSGIYKGRSTGTPIGFIIENTSQRSSDYSSIEHLYRPGHADLGYDMRYGFRDPRGGGRSSGRETACRVFGGALAKLLLRESGISVDAGVVEVGGIKAEDYVWTPPFPGPLNAPQNRNLERMIEAVEKAKSEGESVGGIIECHATGMIPGLGDPVFDKLDATISHAVMSIGAVKGIEFGAGFAVAGMKGSENNDAMRISDIMRAEYSEGSQLGRISSSAWQ